MITQIISKKNIINESGIELVSLSYFRYGHAVSLVKKGKEIKYGPVNKVMKYNSFLK